LISGGWTTGTWLAPKFPSMIQALTAALLIAAGPSPADVRAQLDAVAARIERLKARRLAGGDVEGELEVLLVRAGELAAALEHGVKPAAPPAAGPSAEELRERADALRDEADREDVAARQLDARIEEARRTARLEAGLESLMSESALFGDTGMTRFGGRPTVQGTEGSAVTGGSGARTSTALAPGRDSESPASAGMTLPAMVQARAKAAARAAALRASAEALDAQAKATEAADH